jgi:hypothetical protein
MKTKSAIITLLIAFTLVSFKVSAQPGVVLSDKDGWHKIGETTVDFKKEKDEVMVIGAKRFASVKFKVTDAPVDFIDMEIIYDNDQVHKVNVNSPVQINSESRVIDLKGQERDIKKIVFVYKTLPNRKDDKAHVEIWGYKTNIDKDKDKDKDHKEHKDKDMK